MEITNWLQRNRVLRRLSWCFFQQNRPTVWSYCNQGEASSKSLRGSAYPFQIQTYNTTRLLSLEQKKLPDVLWPNLGGTLACFIFLKPVFICFLFFSDFFVLVAMFFMARPTSIPWLEHFSESGGQATPRACTGNSKKYIGTKSGKGF